MSTELEVIIEVTEVNLDNGKWLACFDINELPDSISENINSTHLSNVGFTATELAELRECGYILY